MSSNFQLGFDERAVAILDKLVETTRVESKAQAVRDALAFYDWVRKQNEAGHSLVLRKSDETLEKVVLPFGTENDEF